MSRKAESIFQDKVLADLDELPYTWSEKISQIAIRGTPDIICCIAGNFVALELKASAHSPSSRLQDYKIQKIIEAGGFGLVVFPEIWPAVLKKLKAKFLKGAKKESHKH